MGCVAFHQNLNSFFVCYVYGVRWPHIRTQRRFRLITDVAVMVNIFGRALVKRGRVLLLSPFTEQL